MKGNLEEKNKEEKRKSETSARSRRHGERQMYGGRAREREGWNLEEIK
jgi:hypothetical protein